MNSASSTSSSFVSSSSFSSSSSGRGGRGGRSWLGEGGGDGDGDGVFGSSLTLTSRSGTRAGRREEAEGKEGKVELASVLVGVARGWLPVLDVD